MLLAFVLGGLVLVLGGAAGLAMFFANREPSSPGEQTADAKKANDDTANPSPSTSGPTAGQGVDTTLPVVAPKEEEKPLTSLPPEEQEKVNKAIGRGVSSLRQRQAPGGSWGGGEHVVGTTALAGLTLLECGVPPDDLVMKRALAIVRSQAPKDKYTYDIALSILFLDRLGDSSDEALLKSLGLRLVAGQTHTGGWTYDCDRIDPRYEAPLLYVLEQTRPRNALELFVTGSESKLNVGLIGLGKDAALPDELKGKSKLDADAPFRGVVASASKLAVDPPPGERKQTPAEKKKETERQREVRSKLESLPSALQKIPSLMPPSASKGLPTKDPPPRYKLDRTDNSNTQFAILGVLAAGRHGVPTDRALGMIVQRFRVSQNRDGSWGYLYGQTGRVAGSTAMTGAGLLGLAVTHGLTAGVKWEGLAAKGIQDTGIQKGLNALSPHIGRPIGKNTGPKVRKEVNPYFLWTVERVCVLYGLPKIGDKDWYAWGVEQLLEVQAKEGQFESGGFPGSTPVTDTCFALLFLKRANLAKDLTSKIKNKLEIVIEDK